MQKKYFKERVSKSLGRARIDTLRNAKNDETSRERITLMPMPVQARQFRPPLTSSSHFADFAGVHTSGSKSV